MTNETCERCGGTGKDWMYSKDEFKNITFDPCPSCQPQQEQKDDIDKLVEKLESGFPQQAPMNQDNQVGWKNEMAQFAEKYKPRGIAAPAFFLNDLSKLIGLVKRDSIAEGIRRAREVVCDVDTECEGRDRVVFNVTKRQCYEVLIKLEEEVKK